jgi:hypothetical protein
MSIGRYQLSLLGPERSTHGPALTKHASALFAQVGLDFSTHAEVLIGGTAAPDWSGFPVAVWFGGAGAANVEDLNVMREFLSRGFSVFPVVTDLRNYTASVPVELHAINGQEWQPERVAADVMKGFRLARRWRQLFISYKRQESSGVAHQLFHQLNERGFHVFLDTASVEAGVDLQKALWGRMADVDLLVLLDSPTALSSQWVHNELNRAHDLGLGVVQLVWPNHEQYAGTELSFPVLLDVTDFNGHASDNTARLRDEKLRDVLAVVEKARIASLNARRTRLVEGLLEHIGVCGGAVQVHPMRHVDVLKGKAKIAEVVPFVGVPDSLALYQCEIERKHEPTIIVYNGLGVDEEWAKHLTWLNAMAKVAVRPIDDFGEYIGRIL